ncbi:hypothetical protein [Ruegeria halocynthiae]|uniref:hypothetical protein n=1 Tax=Ruegeria halocynthiae TaxID=985054 RepID=UPI0015A3875E|nr:hypothetical protein [Ruegeria halocynthiae]
MQYFTKEFRPIGGYRYQDTRAAGNMTSPENYAEICGLMRFVRINVVAIVIASHKA